MTPAKALEDIVCGFGIFMAMDRHKTVDWYLSRGKEIPDFNLPGRVIMMQRPEIRAQLVRLSSADAWHYREEVYLQVSALYDETRRLFERIAHRR